MSSIAHAKSMSKVSARSGLDVIKGYISLTKPRIMLLLLFTGYCGAIVAERGLPSLYTTFWFVVGLALSSGGSAAINCWYDRDIDAIMTRTAARPIPSGLIQPRGALWFGIILGVLSVIVYWVFVNPMTAILSAVGFVYYAVIYTMWLKRSTPQNIVISGGAGSVPPMMGWTAVTGHLAWAPVIMFLIVFFWTPAHFWALALMKNEDYTRAGVPMMPVVRGARYTKVQCLLYTAVLWITSLLLYWTHTVSALYLVGAFILGAWFFWLNIKMWREADDKFQHTRKTFFGSLIYLPVMFILMAAGALM